MDFRRRSSRITVAAEVDFRSFSAGWPGSAAVTETRTASEPAIDKRIMDGDG